MPPAVSTSIPYHIIIKMIFTFECREVLFTETKTLKGERKTTHEKQLYADGAIYLFFCFTCTLVHLAKARQTTV